MTVLFIFLPCHVKAKDIPRHIIKRCQETVRKADPVKITYNYGDLRLDYNKNTAEVSASCKDNAAGCFHGKGSCSWSYNNRSLQMGDYICSFPVAHVTCDFRGTYIDLTNEYEGCNARAVLRHELQHFMIWKTAKDNMIKEMKEKGTEFAIQSAEVCEGYCRNNSEDNLAEILRKIDSKWNAIKNVNDKRLDDVDHDHDTEVNYKVCAPYSLKVISN